MINLETLDAFFGANPDLRKAFTDAMPFFGPDECVCISKTEAGFTPRKSIYIDGKRHIISVRALAAYLVRGEYKMWVPRISCQPGCINPHHQLAMEKGVHKLQQGFTPVERATRSFAKAFEAHRPLVTDPIQARSDEHLMQSFAHTMAQTAAE